MTKEQDRTLEALQIAMQMEIDGKECYDEASQRSTNEVGGKLLQSLSDEEELHRMKLQEIYETIRSKKAWPEIILQPGRVHKIRTEFASSCELIGVKVNGAASDFSAIETAVEKEKKSYDFYNQQSRRATYDAEREFFRAVAAEEREHELLLLEYYEYLANPAGYFVKKEHPSLDGG